MLTNFIFSYHGDKNCKNSSLRHRNRNPGRTQGRLRNKRLLQPMINQTMPTLAPIPKNFFLNSIEKMCIYLLLQMLNMFQFLTQLGQVSLFPLPLSTIIEVLTGFVLF